MDLNKLSKIEIFNYATNKYKQNLIMSLHKDLDFDMLDVQLSEDGTSMKIYLGSNPKEAKGYHEGDE